MSRLFKIACLIVSVLAMAACTTGGDNQDLRNYIQETKSRPAGNIEPIPPFRPYEPYIYSSAAKRSPFERPVEVQRRIIAAAGSDVKPDFNRSKEYLEGFDLSALTMVGNLQKDGTLWALISDPTGTIHWVKNGQYMGKNHGNIVETQESKIELVEIVSDGLSGWVERPRVIALSEE